MSYRALNPMPKDHPGHRFMEPYKEFTLYPVFWPDVQKRPTGRWQRSEKQKEDFLTQKRTLAFPFSPPSNAR